MSFIVQFDLISLLVLIIVPPIVLFLCKSAWIWANDVRILGQNKYVSRIIKENNEVWRDYIRLQEELKKYVKE